MEQIEELVENGIDVKMERMKNIRRERRISRALEILKNREKKHD